MPEVSVFDERLAEIDRRLSTIQSGLEPAAAPAAEPGDEQPAAAAPAPNPAPASVTAPRDPAARDPAPLPPPTQLHAAQPEPPAARLLSQLHELQEAHERLLELHRELLSQYSGLLERHAGEATSAVLTSGPFADAEALRAFERALAALPGVTGVAVREYLGADRVALEVRLAAR